MPASAGSPTHHHLSPASLRAFQLHKAGADRCPNRKFTKSDNTQGVFFKPGAGTEVRASINGNLRSYVYATPINP